MPSFNLSMQGFLDVFMMFRGRVPQDALQPCENLTTYGDYPGIDISNRYFTSVKNAAAEKIVPFTKEEDPHGILTRLQTTNHIHCEKNVVEYFEQLIKSSGEMK